MTKTAKPETRHKEYSLAAAAAAAAVLLAIPPPAGLLPLFLLNLLSIFAIIYSAFSVVRHADVLAHRFGEPYGSLILSLAIVILEVGMISILMLSGSAGETLMRDTIYSVIMIVMTGFIGLALLIGGLKYGTQSFNLTGINHYLISIAPLAVIVLALPTALGLEAYGPGRTVLSGVCCLLMYVTFLKIQTKTHRDFFVYEDEDEDHGHGKPSCHSTAWHFVFLAVHLVAVIGITKLSSTALAALMTRIDAPPAASGLLVALLILSPEGAGAFTSVMRNQVQRAMNLFLGSVLATISLSVPVVSIIAALTGQSIKQALDLPEILIMLVTFMVCQASLGLGKTNTNSGAAHVVLFIIYLMLLF